MPIKHRAARVACLDDFHQIANYTKQEDQPARAQRDAEKQRADSPIAALFSRAVRISRQICWPRRKLLRMLLNFLHHHLDGFLELRIVSRHHFVGRVVNDERDYADEQRLRTRRGRDTLARDRTTRQPLRG